MHLDRQAASQDTVYQDPAHLHKYSEKKFQILTIWLFYAKSAVSQSG